MNKRMLVLMSLVALAIAGCKENFNVGDVCEANQFECEGDSLFWCRYLNKENITRLEKYDDYAQSILCGSSASCEECKKRLADEGKGQCAIYQYECGGVDGKELFQCRYTDSNKKYRRLEKVDDFEEDL